MEKQLEKSTTTTKKYFESKDIYCQRIHNNLLTIIWYKGGNRKQQNEDKQVLQYSMMDSTDILFLFLILNEKKEITP